MKPLAGTKDIEQALQAVGELVAAAGESYSIVILGGAALNLLGVIERATRDVDILAFASDPDGPDRGELVTPPKPLPEPLVKAIRTVAGDFGLADNWLNTGPALQVKAGLPDGLASRIKWRDYAALHVGLTSPHDLIAFKLFAAADDRPGGRHARDLIALRPTDQQLDAAAIWVKGQDANQHEFPAIVDKVVTYVREDRDATHS